MFVSSSVTVISSYTPVLIVWSIFSPCMYVFLCGWVCLCVWMCVVVCLKLEMILFGGLLPDFCIVVSLNQPICICVECPTLKACHTVFSVPVDDLTVLFCFCSPLCPLLFLTILLFLPTFLSASNSPMCTRSPLLYIPHPTHVHFYFSPPRLFFPLSCIYPHLIPFISSLCPALFPLCSVFSQREPWELQPGV